MLKPVTNGTASGTWAKTTACSTRSRSRSLTPGRQPRRQDREDRHPGTARYVVPRQPWHRRREDRAVFDPDAVLRRHHEGQVGLAGRGLDGASSAPTTRTHRLFRCCRRWSTCTSGRVPRHGTARSGRRDARCDRGRRAILQCIDEAFTQLPDAVLTPRATYARLVRAKRRARSRLSALPGRIARSAARAVPAGHSDPDAGRESHGEEARRRRLPARTAGIWTASFPGFEHDTHGVESGDAMVTASRYYMTRCLKA